MKKQKLKRLLKAAEKDRAAAVAGAADSAHYHGKVFDALVQLMDAAEALVRPTLDIKRALENAERVLSQ